MLAYGWLSIAQRFRRRAACNFVREAAQILAKVFEGQPRESYKSRLSPKERIKEVNPSFDRTI